MRAVSRGWMYEMGVVEPGVGMIDHRINLALNYGSLENDWINI